MDKTSRQKSIVNIHQNMDLNVAFKKHFNMKKIYQNNLFIPFIPNLLRRLYLLMRTKITMRKTQPKPARPTAIDIYREKAIKQSMTQQRLLKSTIEIIGEQKEHLTPNESSSGLFASSSAVGATGHRNDIAQLRRPKNAFIHVEH